MTGELHRLPRGRHGLTREEVLASQRGRMLAAVAELVAGEGFARVSVADIIRRAGVSRETFYEQFTGKEDCFLSALDAGAEALLGVLEAALGRPTPDPGERLDRMLAAYLEVLAEESSFAKAYLIDAYGAGQRATARRIELQQRFVEVVTKLLAPGRKGKTRDTADRFACEALVAAISSLVTIRVGVGAAHELPELREPLMELAGRLFPILAQASASNSPQLRRSGAAG